MFTVHEVQNYLQEVSQEDLAPHITSKWLSDRLDKAPSEDTIVRYLFRERHFPLSINAQRMLRSCGRAHYKALQLLREGASSEGKLETMVKSAITNLELAWQEFYMIQEDLNDYNHCLGDCECLMNTTCLILLMFNLTKEWATTCLTMIRRGRLYLPGISPIPLQENFDDADEVCRSLLRSYQMYIEGIIKTEELSMRQQVGKERARVSRPQIQYEALQVPSRVQNIIEPPIQPVCSFGVESPQPMWTAFMAAPPLLDHGISTSVGAYCLPTSVCYSPSIYDFSASASTSSRSVPSKRRLSVEDELENQRPVQRRKTLPDPTPMSTSTTESTAPIFPQFQPLGLTTPQYPDLGIFSFPDYFSWEPEKPIDLALWDESNVNNISTLLAYQEGNVVRPLMAHYSTGNFS